MGIFDKITEFASRYSNNQDNIGKVINDTAGDIIKKLSGEDIRQTKRVIDNVVVFAGASGGTGASTIVTNVAKIATEKKFSVLIIDLNIMYPSQHSALGVRQELKKSDLVSYLTGKDSLGDCIENIGNISLMYANNRSLIDSINCNNDSSISNLKLAIDKLRNLYDLILVDVPMKVESLLINYMLYISDSIYLVWDEGLQSISNTEKIRRNMASSGIDAYTKMRVVLNKKTNINYSNYPFQKLNLELVEVLPFAVEIIECSLKGSIFCEKASSDTENANKFYTGIVNLTDKVLENGGYIK